MPLNSHADPSFGGHIGVNLAKFRRPSGQPTSFDRSFRTGFMVGGSLHLRYWTAVFPRFELSFARRGTNLDEDGMNPGALELDYLDASVVARAEQPIYDAVVFGAIGPQLSLLVAARQIEDSGTRDAKGVFASWDLGFAASLGIMTPPTRWGTFSIQSRYDMGFFDVSETEFSVLKNIGISILIGYEYRRQPRDSDADGIADDADRCPKQAEDRNSYEDGDGCPDADKDSDSDGVMNFEDRCRDEPKGRDGVKGGDGCSESEL
ncbi:MAG: outer membrane beta-barrel protein [Proteobacteria bacterium]|nr:outer membrane beta-barrel protein [Pseudomonadota bacterium]